MLRTTWEGEAPGRKRRQNKYSSRLGKGPLLSFPRHSCQVFLPMRARQLQGKQADRVKAGMPPAPTLSAVVGLSGLRRASSKILSSERSCDQFQSVVHQQDCVRLRIIPQTVYSSVPVSARLSACLPVYRLRYKT